MIASLIAMSALVGATQGENPYGKPLAVAESRRIALTPKLDGVASAEEWDALTAEGTVSTFFQWEPGKFHVGTLTAAPAVVVVSVDLGNNGWLIGDDNLEVRLEPGPGSNVVASARMLDGTNPAGPVWRPLPGFSVASEAKLGRAESMELLEATIHDPGLGILPTDDRRKVGLRVDILPLNTPPSEPYLPRPVVPIELVMARDAGLPEKMVFRPGNYGRAVVPEQTIKLRFGFEGTNDLGIQKLNLRSEGEARDATNLVEVPFPRFDNKGRAFVDYETAVAAGASVGYRVARGTLNVKDGVAGVAQMSYRIAPDVDIEVINEIRRTDAVDRTYKQAFRVRSNSGKGLVGQISVSVPGPLRIINSPDRRLNLTSRGQAREVFEIYVPASTSGTFPVYFDVTIGGNKTRQTGFVTIR
ncbi:MAG: hypothetical protein SFX74_03855 [Fimbriimonadaceae bacterium]|nr:hypothetical protein [Fimbriimonadaceae bacterium]